MESRRSELIGVNAEDYSEKRANDYYIIKSFYKDLECSDPLFPEEKDYNKLYADEVSYYINCYNTIFKLFEELKIQEMEINNEESNNEITILFIGLLNERRKNLD